MLHICNFGKCSIVLFNKLSQTLLKSLIFFSGPAQYVRLGALNITMFPFGDKPQDFKLKRLIAHPQYHQPLKYHDIGLIELDRSVNRDEFVNVACLDTERNHKEFGMKIAGWGQTEFAASSSNILLKANVDRVAFDRCSSFYQADPKVLPRGLVDDWMICAGGKSDTCNVSIS